MEGGREGGKEGGREGGGKHFIHCFMHFRQGKIIEMGEGFTYDYLHFTGAVLSVNGGRDTATQAIRHAHTHTCTRMHEHVRRNLFYNALRHIRTESAN
jgi:hypothetical protein